jgi:hypothetical protein
MISCSHTHSGPWAAGRLDVESLEQGKEENPEYIRFLINAIVSVLISAKKSLPRRVPECLGCAAAGYPAAATGAFGRPERSPRSVLQYATGKVRPGTSLSLHASPTFNSRVEPRSLQRTTLLSPCRAQRAGEPRVSAFRRASGNQSSSYYRQGGPNYDGRRGCRAIGRRKSALWQAVWTDGPSHHHRQSEVPIEIRSFGSVEELEHPPRARARTVPRYRDCMPSMASRRTAKNTTSGKTPISRRLALKINWRMSNCTPMEFESVWKRTKTPRKFK